MTDFKQAHLDFEKYLTKEKSRYTDQKRAIAQAVFEHTDHFEIETFVSELNTQGHRFSRATFYRTIKQLLDAGLIQKILTRDGRVFYEQNTSKDHHAHIICNSCGKIFEIPEMAFEQPIQSYCETMSFTPKYHSIHIYAECFNAQCTHSAS